MQQSRETVGNPPQMRQLVDWPVALLAGLVAGTVFLLIILLRVPPIFGSTAWLPLQYLASLVMGPEVLPPAEPTAIVGIVGVVAHYALAIGFALVLAFITHRWGFWVGIIVGAAFGLGVYLINLYFFTLLFPWMYVLNGTTFATGHIFFGALAGAIYEGFERERFVPIDDTHEPEEAAA